jgi:hypothetical protein
MLFHLMNVMKNRTEIVEEFGIDGPPFVLFPDGIANDVSLPFFDGIFKEKFFAVELDVTQTLVGLAAGIGGFGCTAEPAFVNSAAVNAECVPIGGGEFDTSTGLHEISRHPSGNEPKNPLTGIHCFLKDFADVIFLDGGGTIFAATLCHELLLMIEENLRGKDRTILT